MNSRRISWPISARFKNCVPDFGKPGIFLNSRQGYASSGVYNINGVLRSSFEFFDRLSNDIRISASDGTLRYGHTESNLRTSLRSSVYSVYYRTGRCRMKWLYSRFTSSSGFRLTDIIVQFIGPMTFKMNFGWLLLTALETRVKW